MDECLLYYEIQKKISSLINFQSFLNENYKWVFLLRSGKHFFVILPFMLIFGFYYKSYKNKKILKLWELEEELDN